MKLTLPKWLKSQKHENQLTDLDRLPLFRTAEEERDRLPYINKPFYNSRGQPGAATDCSSYCWVDQSICGRRWFTHSM